MANVNLLAVTIGNTRTRVGSFVEDELRHAATLENAHADRFSQAFGEAFDPLREKDDAVVLICSVNPPVCERVEKLVRDDLGREVLRVEKDVAVPIGRQLDPEAIVGEDRLLNAAAAYDVLKQACVVVDAGTALTIDFIDGAGTFHGGAIAPGGQLMLDALTGRAAMLPNVELTAPSEAIGHNTTEAMKAGAFHGLRGTVRELVEQMAQQVGQFPLVVATGGDANLLFRDYELMDRVVPDLTLMGLALTVRTAMQRREAGES